MKTKRFQRTAAMLLCYSIEQTIPPTEQGKEKSKTHDVSL